METPIPKKEMRSGLPYLGMHLPNRDILYENERDEGHPEDDK